MTLHCPRCQQVLASVEIDDAGVRTEALRCIGCGGHFFERGRLEPIQDIVKLTLFEHRHVPSKDAQRAPLPCPSCAPGEPMMKVSSHRDDKVIVDVCPRCRGTWLDAGELAAMQEEGLLTFLANLLRWMG